MSECLGPECAGRILDWLRARMAEPQPNETRPGAGQLDLLGFAPPYVDEAPALRSPEEFRGALEHLEYAVFRRFNNQLTRAERARLDNSIENALFKAARYASMLEGDEREAATSAVDAISSRIASARERSERLRRQAQRANQRLAQLSSLTPEAFEDFVAELFEALGFEVQCVGGTDDQGIDLRLNREGLTAIAQCKYHSKGVIGSPDLQKFLGAVHASRSHKGYFVTTGMFSLAAERFAMEQPIELVDGPRLVSLLEMALGTSSTSKPDDPLWF